MALSGAPPRLCVLSPRETLRPRSSPGWFLNARRDWSRCPNARGALVADALSLPLQRVRRYVKLDLAADAVPVINYKKLKREQDAPASAPRPAGATRDPMLEGGAAPPPNPRALAHMGGPQPGDGGGAGNHMAAVIRRIEAIYSAPRFDDSDEDDASRGAEDAPEPGDASASDDDDDFEDDGRDPNDPAVVAERAAKKAARAVKKAEQAKKRKTSNQPEEWYDVDDDFIDDEELDEYFERNGRKTKLGGEGADRFYVNRGELEFEDDGTGAAQVAEAARRRAAAIQGGEVRDWREWTDVEMAALKRGVERHGRRWMTIKRDQEVGNLLRDFNPNAMKHKWRKMMRDGLVRPLTPTQAGSSGGTTATGSEHADAPKTAAEVSDKTPHVRSPLGKGAGEHAEAYRAEAAANATGALREASQTEAAANADAAPSSNGVARAPGASSIAREAAEIAAAAAAMPVLGHGSNGRYSDVLTACIDEVRAVAANEIPPEKGSRARLPDAIVEKLEKIVRVCKDPNEPGGDPTAALPRGLLKTLMEFLDPFCSPVTLQKRMSLMSEAYMKGPGGKGSDKPALAAGAGFH